MCIYFHIYVLFLLLICYNLSDIFFLSRIGLGALISGARIVSDGMLQAASEWYELKQKHLELS